MKQPMLLFAFIALAFALAMTGCTKKTSPPSADLTPQQLAERGRSIYVSNCISCHHTDPSKDGSIGPSVSQSSMELLEQRLLHASYPSGYKPKRETRAMVAMPHLKGELPALHAYLETVLK